MLTKEEKAMANAKIVYNRIKHLPLEEQKEVLNRLYVGLPKPENNPLYAKNPNELESNIIEVFYIMQAIRKKYDMTSLELLNIIENGIGIEEAVNNCKYLEYSGNEFDVFERWKGKE